MPMTDLPTAPQPVPAQGGVRTLLRQLGMEDEFGNPPYPLTGALHFLHNQGPEATVYLQDGFIYAAHMTGYVPQIVRRLRSAGCLSDEEFDMYKDMDPAEAGPRIVTELNVPADVLEETHREVLLATVSHLYEWSDSRWYWEEDTSTTAYMTSGIPSLLVVSAVDERIGQWAAVVRTNPLATQPHVVPKAGPGWQSKVGVTISPEMAAMLSCINGRNTIAQIASTCGFTRFEIAKLLSQATADNVLNFDIEQPQTVEAIPSATDSPVVEEIPVDEIGMSTGMDLEQRVAQLEAEVAELRTIINQLVPNFQ